MGILYVPENQKQNCTYDYDESRIKLSNVNFEIIALSI